MTESRKLQVVLVDDSQKPVDEIVGALTRSDLRLARTTMEPLSSKIEFRWVVIAATDDDAIVAQAKEAVAGSSLVDLVLVDLSFDPQARTGAVDRGRFLALELQKFATCPVGVYTKHSLKPRHRAQIAADGFAVVLEEVRKMYEDEERLGGDDWLEVFRAAARRQSRPSQIDSSVMEPTVSHSTPTLAAEPPTGDVRPFVFIGGTVEALPLARAMQNQLQHECRTVIWNQRGANPSLGFLEAFLNTTDEFEFGIFVLSPDDLSVIRDTIGRAVRGNVLLELGVFLGRVGRERCFIMAPQHSKATELRIHEITDLIGITPVTYNETDARDDRYRQAAVGPACNDILDAIKRPRNHRG